MISYNVVNCVKFSHRSKTHIYILGTIKQHVLKWSVDFLVLFTRGLGTGTRAGKGWWIWGMYFSSFLSINLGYVFFLWFCRMLKTSVYKKILALWCCLLAVDLAESVLQCCNPNVSVDYFSLKCLDGKNISISCINKRIFNRDVSTYLHYIIGNDSEGTYLDSYVAGYIVREPQ